MEVAKCPECGHDLSPEDIASPQIRLAMATGALLATAAIMDMLLQLPEYEHARPGFDERLKEITEKVQETVDHFSDWGDSFDG